MKYGQAISSAFSTMKSGALWGFAASMYGAIALVYVLLLGGAVAAVGPSRLAGLTRDPGSGDISMLGPILGLLGALLLALLFSIPLSLIMHGGFVHLSDEILAGRPVSVGSGWSFGARRMGRTFAIDFVVGLIAFFATLVAVVPFVVALGGLVTASSGSDTPSAGAIVGICGGYLVFLGFLVILSLLVSAYESLAIRYGLVGGRTAGDALGAGWSAFRARWKNVLVFSLIVLGLQYAFSLLSSMVTVPLQFVLIPSQFLSSGTPGPEQLPRLFGGYAILIVVSVLITVPWMVFRYSLWTAFFRQLTGLDVIAAPPVPSIYTPAQYPAPPSPPAIDA